MNAAYLINKVTAAMNRVGPMSRNVYLRTTTGSSGDALIGRATSTTNDAKFTPQPTYIRLGKRDMIYLTSIGQQVTADDYKLTFSPAAVTELQLMDKSAQLVLKDDSGVIPGEEVLRMIYVNNADYQGSTVVITVIARSVSNSG